MSYPWVCSMSILCTSCFWVFTMSILWSCYSWFPTMSILTGVVLKYIPWDSLEWVISEYLPLVSLYKLFLSTYHGYPSHEIFLSTYHDNPLHELLFQVSTFSWNFFWKVGPKSVAIWPRALQVAYRTLGCWERRNKTQSWTRIVMTQKFKVIQFKNTLLFY